MNLTDDQAPLVAAARLAEALGVPSDLVNQLHGVHARQWQLEDATRERGASAVDIATAKAAIDASNARRHRLIDAIDTSVRYTASGTASRRCYSETVGELCDRLLILDLKYKALLDRGHTLISDKHGQEHEPIRQVLDLAAHLSVVVAQFIADVAAGRAVVPPRMGVKVYRACDGSGLPKPLQTAITSPPSRAESRGQVR